VRNGLPTAAASVGVSESLGRSVGRIREMCGRSHGSLAVRGALRDKLEIECDTNEIIQHDGAGYRYPEWIRDRDSGSEPEVGTVAESKGDALNERQGWVLQELRCGERVQLATLERKLDVRERTAKPDLAELVRRGMIEFVRAGREGYYRIVHRKLTVPL